SHLGDRALVFADGRMEGLVGGSCSRDIVRRHGLEAIRSGTPRLLHIRPEPPSEEQEPGGRGEGIGAEHVFIPMSCASEGATDVYVEPHLPARRLIVAGFSPVAHALVTLAGALDYDVVHVVDEDEIGELAGSSDTRIKLDGLQAMVRALSATERARTIAIVASLGHYDEAALEALLDANLGFIGLVASRKRAARVFGILAQGGCSPEQLATVRNPVGLDIGARTPGDVAVSILAEIVATLPSAQAATAEQTGAAPERAIALDPICGMDVEIETARHRFELDGRVYYFCAAGCRAAFAADPAAVLSSRGNA
ncbi:MAG: XdhC family protein, partial [Vulcanimicrobiaceae bacterium]